jgi:hypothetical protein
VIAVWRSMGKGLRRVRFWVRANCGVVSKMLVSDEDRIPRPWAAFLIFWGGR